MNEAMTCLEHCLRSKIRPDYGAIGDGVAPQDLTQRSLLMCTQKERLGTHNMLRTNVEENRKNRERERKLFLCFFQKPRKAQFYRRRKS